MDRVNDLRYQRIVRTLRLFVDHGNPERWPGKSLYAHAVSRYPNIAAEMHGSGYYPPFELAAEFAGVSREVMAAVIEDNEELSPGELNQLAWRWSRGPVGYLACPVLQTVDPSTNKGRRRRAELEALAKSEGIAPFLRQRAGEVLSRMSKGEVVTYAEWRGVCRAIEEALEYRHAEEMKRCCTRTKRRVSA